MHLKGKRDFMEKRILVESASESETRIAVVQDGVLEDYYIETADCRSLKGNIYLAKVARIEPALQAAFIDYGGDQHGFLPFAEIHPDYFRIPIEDRQALSAEERGDDEDEVDVEEDVDVEEGDDVLGEGEDSEDSEGGVGEEVSERDEGRGKKRESRRVMSRRRYRIQEVIKKNQIMLVQVTKERRGNKGVSLSTYIALASRYCVFMANSTRGGGVSRKIGGLKERIGLKKLLSEIDVPKGQALILRTAGAGRSKAALKKDYQSIVGVWDNIRGRTMEATAPTLIHEEANLTKRLVRDFYDAEVKEIVVSGESFYKEVRESMDSILPSHKKKIKRYKGGVPLFQVHGIEESLDSIFDQSVKLPSGGSLVVTPTEALVSIDVNSGRATRERSIGSTALKTNLEAADEVARQLRLRDLAGLIVIDFIDMDDYGHRRQVEGRLHEALRVDRARLKVGEISMFGLLEMSRQRLRSSMNELGTERCVSCGGSGYVLSKPMRLRKLIRVLEGYVMKVGQEKLLSFDTPRRLVLKVGEGLGFSFLNMYRRDIVLLEDEYNVRVDVEDLESGSRTFFELCPDKSLLSLQPLEDKESVPLKRSRGGRGEGRGGGRNRQNEGRRWKNEEGGDSPESKESRRGKRGSGRGRRGGGREDGHSREKSPREEGDEVSDKREGMEGEERLPDYGSQPQPHVEVSEVPEDDAGQGLSSSRSKKRGGAFGRWLGRPKVFRDRGEEEGGSSGSEMVLDLSELDQKGKGGSSEGGV
jgi:ribonuclease E